MSVTPTDEATIEQLIQLNQNLLESIVSGDWEAYQDLCDESLTCFEPEARGHLVEGLEFHKFYFELGPKSDALINVTMASPHVRLLADSAIISYVRLTQVLDANGSPITKTVEETRVWQQIDGKWKHVHFHRSFPS